MQWVRLDTSYTANLKLHELARRKHWRAAAVYPMSLAWCGAAESDGFIPATALPQLHADKTTAAQLVDVGLWQPTHGGWLIPDWADYQPTREQQQQRTKRMQQLAHKRWHPDA